MENPPDLVTEISSSKNKLPDAYIAIMEAEHTAQRVVVRKNLRTLHPLAAQTLTNLSSGGASQGVIQQRLDSLDIRVSKTSLKRAILIADALVTALEARGHKVTIGASRDHSTVVQIEQETVAFRIKEKIAWVKRAPTSEKGSRRIVDTFASSFDYNPTGLLSVVITQPWGIPKSEWRDSKRQKLEDSLNQAIGGLIYAALYRKQQRLERERERQARRELERQRLQQLESIRAEEARVELLKSQAECWETSQRIRKFVDALRCLLRDREIQIVSGQPVQEWIEWALAQADRLDPWTPSPASILDEKEKAERGWYKPQQ